jgi:hypothetical protein
MAQALVRFNAAVMGAVVGVVASVGVFVATAVLLLRGGENPGPMLGLLRYVFPGYTVTWGGALVGAFWALLAGAALGMVLGFAYGPWLLRGATRALDAQPGGDGADEPDSGVLLLRPLPFALVSAGLLSAGLFVTTNWLALRGWPSPHLALLAHYLPGYTTDLLGSLVGAFWVFLYAFLATGLAAVVYDRVAALRGGG